MNSEWSYICVTQITLICYLTHCVTGPGSVVGIATGYGLDGPGIEYWWEGDFPHLSRPAMGSTQPPVQWVPGVKSGWIVTPTPHPLLGTRSLRHERVELYLYSPYGLYGLYKASVPVQGCTYITPLCYIYLLFDLLCSKLFF
jgi:hypothetical protein